MKKNDWIYAFSILVYSFLFWKQLPGINFIFMNAVLLGGLLIRDKSLIRNRSWLLAAIGAVGSAFCVAWFGSPLSVAANFLSLLLASSFVVNRNNSFLVATFLSLCSIAASIGFMIIDSIERRKKKTVAGTTGGKSGKRFVIVLLALVVALIFFFMYRSSNLLFQNLTDKINLDFISFGWIAFTIFGAVIFYGFFYHHSIPDMASWDAKHALQLRPTEEQSWLDKLMSMDSEHFSGMVLLGLLNALLLVVNGLDAAFIFGGNKMLPEGVTYTEYVHQGVGMLITSIVCAMLIILYYFRGRMNFLAKNKGLKLLAMLWIAQNAFMLFTTAWRNQGYIHEYGLTYKRIGVYVYLLLTLIGLATTAWKVNRQKTNAYLVRVNSWLFYSVWIISCFVNWDQLIFNYNVNVAHKPDIAYLNKLSYKILPDLARFELPGNVSAVEKQELQRHIFHFMNQEEFLHEENKWPSMVFKANQVYDELQADRSIHYNTEALNAWNSDLKKVYFFPGFSDISSLNLSENELTDVSRIGQYKNLVTLELNGNRHLESLKGVEGLTNLQRLDVSDTKVDDFTPLLNLPNLKELTVSQMTEAWRIRLAQANPGLNISYRNSDWFD